MNNARMFSLVVRRLMFDVCLRITSLIQHARDLILNDCEALTFMKDLAGLDKCTRVVFYSLETLRLK